MPSRSENTPFSIPEWSKPKEISDEAIAEFIDSAFKESEPSPVTEGEINEMLATSAFAGMNEGYEHSPEWVGPEQPIPMPEQQPQDDNADIREWEKELRDADND